MKIRNYILYLIFLGVAVFFLGFSPQKAEASDFGGLIVNTKIQYPGRSAIALNGVNVTVSTVSGGSYSGRCGGGSYGSRSCSSAGIINLSTSPDTCMSSIPSVKTAGAGKVEWLSDNSGIEFSSCNCSFSIDLSAPAAPSGYVYDGGWSPVEPYITGIWANGTNKSLTFTIKVKPNTPAPVDILNPSLSNNVLDSKLDCVEGKCDEVNPTTRACTNNDGAVVSLTANPGHTADPAHSGLYYKFDWTNNGSYDTGWVTSATQAHVYQSDEIGGVPASSGKVITAKVLVKCAGGLEDSATTTFTLYPATHSLICNNLNVIPGAGYIPLSAKLIADITDNYTCDDSGITYSWNFGDGSPVKTTYNESVINYTYITEGLFRPRVNVSKGSLTTVSCPAESTITSRKFSDTNYKEIAP